MKLPETAPLKLLLETRPFLSSSYNLLYIATYKRTQAGFAWAGKWFSFLCSSILGMLPKPKWQRHDSNLFQM